jgi:kynurenine formamidase
MHVQVFIKPFEIIHAENLGGQLNELGNRRMIVGCFPWKFQDGESSIARIVAFE